MAAVAVSEKMCKCSQCVSSEPRTAGRPTPGTFAPIVGNPTWPCGIEVHPPSCKGRQMDIIAEFQKHADECRRMARATRDFQSKVAWNRMAERWQGLLAAEQARSR